MLKRRRTGHSVFGLALVSMLVFGALAASAAQASPQWHKNGKTLQELGLSQMPINQSGGSLSLEVPGWELTVDCTSGGVGHAVGASSGSMHLDTNQCSVKHFEKHCEVSPMSFDFALGLEEGGETGVIETFTPGGGSEIARLVISGELCPFNELEFPIGYEAGRLGAEVGAENGVLPLTGLPARRINAYVSEEPVYISLSGSVAQSEETGAAIGAW
jgi:hypothetical protein